jgi:hypothetical protein
MSSSIPLPSIRLSSLLRMRNQLDGANFTPLQPLQAVRNACQAIGQKLDFVWLCRRSTYVNACARDVADHALP